MAHFLKPPSNSSVGYDANNELAPGSLWRVRILVGTPRTVALWGGAGLRVKSNNPGVVPNDPADGNRLPELAPTGDLRVFQLFGANEGGSFIDVWGPDNSFWIRVQALVQNADLTIDRLRAIMPHASRAQADRFIQPLIAHMQANNINTGLRKAHFLAQVGHESGELRFTEEIASGDQYENRADLGNTQPGDGRRFKGRGLIQLTGRANYRAFGNARGRDFLNEPNNLLIASDTNLAVDVSCFFWTTRNLNARADLDDLIFITQRVNGGQRGIANRRELLERAKDILLVY